MELIRPHIVPGARSSGDRPLKRDLTPESKSTKTPSKSQNILYLKSLFLAVVVSLSSSLAAFAFAEVKNPVSDDCCCLAFFLDDDLSPPLPLLLRLDDIRKSLGGSVLMNDDDDEVMEEEQ